MAAAITTTQTEHGSAFLTLKSGSQRPKAQRFAPDASIILVGSRGSGKRSLGFIGATHLGRRFVTEDHFFLEATGLSRSAYLQQYGDKEFFKRTLDVLKQMLHTHRVGCMIECGMSSLSKEAQQLLYEVCKSNPVIWIRRSSARIQQLLDLEDDEASRLEKADLAHRYCSNFEYYNLYDSTCDGMDTPPDPGLPNVSSRLKHAKQDFSSFLDFITGQGVVRSGLESPFSIAALPPECRSYSYALSLRMTTVPDLELELLESGADAVQLKIDSLLVPDIRKLLGRQVATIRRILEVPVIIQVEEYVFEEASMPMSDREAIYFELLEQGLRLGAEYITVDLKHSPGRVSHLVRCSGRTKVIGHYLANEENSLGWDDESRMIQYQSVTFSSN